MSHEPPGVKSSNGGMTVGKFTFIVILNLKPLPLEIKCIRSILNYLNGKQSSLGYPKHPNHSAGGRHHVDNRTHPLRAT